jgi:hypothetical protein
MVRGERRRWSGAPAALRWIAADARDVARIDRSTVRPAKAVETIARGVRLWQHRVERRRRLALMRRAGLVGLGAACAIQSGALATGNSGAGVWLIPGALLAALVLAIGITHPTSASSAARLLDRDLALGAAVATALELENSQRLAAPRGLAALALADGRAVLATSLVFARARLQPRRGELALLAALVAGFAVLVLVPSPRNDGAAVAASGANARSTPPSSRALRAENGLATSAKQAPSLQGFQQAQPDAPPLAAVQAGGTTRSGGAAAGHSPYSGGVSNTSAAGTSAVASRTSGQSGAVKGTQDDVGSPSGPSQGSGSLPNSSAGKGKENIVGGSSAKGNANGARSVTHTSQGQQKASAPGGPQKGSASRVANKSQGGSGSSAAGSAQGSKTAKRSPGGTTAGSTGGGKNRGKGVVPQLGRSNSVLPLAPGYESVPGAKGATDESASSTVGRGGGAGHSGQAIGVGAGSGAGVGVPFVPPGGAAVASIDRSVVLGYFASFARVNASGW